VQSFVGIILPPSSGYKIANLDFWHNLHPSSLFHFYGSITGQFTNVLQSDVFIYKGNLHHLIQPLYMYRLKFVVLYIL